MLFALVGAESTGVPVPGETGLITAAVLARHCGAAAATAHRPQLA